MSGWVQGRNGYVTNLALVSYMYVAGSGDSWFIQAVVGSYNSGQIGTWATQAEAVQAMTKLTRAFDPASL
jgi:hypothetical protein